MGKSTKAASKLIKFGGIHMSFLQDVLNIVIKYYPQLLKGVGNTMLLALTGTVAGLVIGLLTGVIRTAPMSKTRCFACFIKFSMQSLRFMLRFSAALR